MAQLGGNYMMKDVVLHTKVYDESNGKATEHTIYMHRVFLIGDARYFYERKEFNVSTGTGDNIYNEEETCKSFVEITYGQFNDIRKKLLNGSL